MSNRKLRADRVILAGGTVLVLGLLGFGLANAAKDVKRHTDNPANTAFSTTTAAVQTTETQTTASTTAETTTETTAAPYPDQPGRSSKTVSVEDTDLVIARNFVLLDCPDDDSAEILAERKADERIYPASLTKIMTMLTFFELCGEDAVNDTVTMDAAAIASAEEQQAYTVGFKAGEQCSIKDLLYAMMLPSGADAALMLADHAAGSEEKFVKQMNLLAAKMGLWQTHFVNCVGLHDDGHYTTAAELSTILRAALRRPACRELMSVKKYTTAATDQHPEGIELLSTTLSRMNGDELEFLPEPMHIIGGKTGYTNPAGQCLATWAETAGGHRYICIVTGSTALHSMDAVSDTLTIYQLAQNPLDGLKRIVLREEDIIDPPPHF